MKENIKSLMMVDGSGKFSVQKEYQKGVERVSAQAKDEGVHEVVE